MYRPPWVGMSEMPGQRKGREEGLCMGKERNFQFLTIKLPYLVLSEQILASDPESQLVAV